MPFPTVARMALTRCYTCNGEFCPTKWRAGFPGGSDEALRRFAPSKSCGRLRCLQACLVCMICRPVSSATSSSARRAESSPATMRPPGSDHSFFNHHCGSPNVEGRLYSISSPCWLGLAHTGWQCRSRPPKPVNPWLTAARSVVSVNCHCRQPVSLWCCLWRDAYLDSAALGIALAGKIRPYTLVVPNFLETLLLDDAPHDERVAPMPYMPDISRPTLGTMPLRTVRKPSSRASRDLASFGDLGAGASGGISSIQGLVGTRPQIRPVSCERRSQRSYLRHNRYSMFCKLSVRGFGVGHNIFGRPGLYLR